MNALKYLAGALIGALIITLAVAWYLFATNAVQVPSFVKNITSSTPSADAARKVLEIRAARNANGCIKIVDCQKTNGMEQDYQWAKFYELDCTATIEFLQDCCWDQSSQLNTDPKPLDSRQYSVLNNHQIVQNTAWYGRPFDPLSFQFYWRKGERTTFTEKFQFEKTERGWRDGNGNIY